ncbi:MAG: YncE family protein [Bacteroidetes bacterium]|nr:YncE family protein [Bacteroidota bacterium]
MIKTIQIILLAGFCLVSCKTDPEEPQDSAQLSYDRDVQPVFTRSCAVSGCHLENHTLGKPAHEDTTLTLGSYAELAAGTLKGGAVVVPFEPALSSLFQHVNQNPAYSPVATPSMPFNRDPLPAKEIDLLRTWISEGAKGPSGTPLYSTPGSSGRFLMTNQGEDFLTLFDISKRTVTRIIPLFNPTWPAPQSAPAAPHYVAVSPDGNTAFVTFYTAGKLIRVDLISRKLTGEIYLGGTPAHVELTADGKKAIVSNFSSRNQLHLIDTESMTLIRNFSGLTASPHGICLSADEKTIWSAGNSSDLLYSIETETGKTESYPLSPLTPPIGETAPKLGPYQLRTNGNDLVISCKFSGEIRFFNTQTKLVTDSVKTGKYPLLMEINPKTNELWVANQGSKSISVIHLSSHSVVEIGNLPDQPHGVEFSPDGAFAGITCENTTGPANQHHPTTRGGKPGVFVLMDAQTKSVLLTRNVGSFAAGITWIP